MIKPPEDHFSPTSEVRDEIHLLDGIYTVAAGRLIAPTTGATKGATAVRKAEAVLRLGCFPGSSCS